MTDHDARWFCEQVLAAEETTVRGLYVQALREPKWQRLAQELEDQGYLKRLGLSKYARWVTTQSGQAMAYSHRSRPAVKTGGRQ